MTLRYRTAAHGAASRAVVAVLLVAAAFTGSGCGVRSLGRGINPVNWRPAPRAAVRADAIAEAREHARLAPAEPYWPYRAGELSLQADSLANAESALREALKIDPSYAPALALLSKLQYDSGRHAEAVDLLEAAREAYASRPGGFPPALQADLALHYDRLEQRALAGDAVAKLARPERSEQRAAAVYVMLRGSTPDRAAAPAAEALREHPDRAVHHNNFGITRLRAGDVEGARKAFLAAIDRDPKLPGPYYNLAILEKYYRFDDAAAARWFGDYWKRSHEDPDGLATVFGMAPVRALAAEKGDVP